MVVGGGSSAAQIQHELLIAQRMLIGVARATLCHTLATPLSAVDPL